MSLDDDFFLCVCWFVAKEKKISLFLLDFGSPFFFIRRRSQRNFFTLFKKENASSSDTSFLFYS